MQMNLTADTNRSRTYMDIVAYFEKPFPAQNDNQWGYWALWYEPIQPTTN